MNWEDGEVRTITMTAVAGNADLSESPGTGRKWRVLYGNYYLDTDGNAANRYMNIILEKTDGTDLVVIGISAVVVANQTGSISILPLNYGSSLASLGRSDCNVNSTLLLNESFIISGTNKLTFAVSGGLAGDAHSGYLVVQELPI